MSDIVLTVVGLPAPQGSKKAWVNKATGRAQMREQSSDRISLWRQDVKAAANDCIASREGTGDPFATLGAPLQLQIEFYFPRPKSHYRTGRNAGMLRDNAPLWPVSRATGDIDKLARATADALQIAGMFADDGQVASLVAWKFYADTRQPGATITIRNLDAIDFDEDPDVADRAAAQTAPTGQEVAAP